MMESQELFARFQNAKNMPQQLLKLPRGRPFSKRNIHQGTSFDLRQCRRKSLYQSYATIDFLHEGCINKDLVRRILALYYRPDPDSSPKTSAFVGAYEQLKEVTITLEDGKVIDV